LSDETHQDDDADSGGGLQIEVLKSYVAFFKRAVRERWLVALSVFLAGVSLTGLAAKYLPRTFTCETIMMGDGSEVLERYNFSPFAGADGLIMRQENLEGIIRDTGLMRKYYARRPPLLKLKDQVSAKLFGPPSDEVLKDVLVGTLENRLQVAINNGLLRVSADWTDGPTAAELVEAASNSFLSARHNSEVSAFQDKMAILDEHATNLRREMDGLAKQIRVIQEQKATDAKKAASVASSPTPGHIIRRSRAPETTDTVPAALTSKLVDLKKKLADLDGDRQRRLQGEQEKLSELKLRLAPAHPEIITQQNLINMLSQIPPEVRSLQSEIDATEAELDERSRMAKATGDGASGLTSGHGGSEAANEGVPTEIIRLLEDDGIDPALTAQLGGAISKYGDLRAELRSTRIALDTAQAAFNYRYKVIRPAEVPTSPTKPKIPLIVLGGLFGSLLLAFLIPVLSELRRGIMIERWQVHMVSLPVLGELRLPPRSD
jgi:uncharacterized protein involved in exopolysaccharide biosynthesis